MLRKGSLAMHPVTVAAIAMHMPCTLDRVAFED